MVKHWLRPEIQESIQFLSTDEMPLLLEECGADNLPAWVFESSAAVRAQALEQTPEDGQAGDTIASSAQQRIDALRDRLHLLRDLERKQQLGDVGGSAAEARQEKARLKKALRALDCTSF